MSDGPEIELHRKLFIIDSFPGKQLISNIFEIRCGRKRINYFFGFTFYKQSFGTYCRG